MRILVTGGAGYVGSAIVRRLAADGRHDIDVYDDLSTGHREAVHGYATLIEGDIRDQQHLTNLMATRGYHALLHFAALADVSEGERQPARYWDVNVRGTLALLDAASWSETLRHVIFASSSAVYGQTDARYKATSEPEELKPLSVYGQTKLAGEMAIAARTRLKDLSYYALRLFNAAGSDSPQLHGEDHAPETHLIPTLLRRAAAELHEGGRQPTTLYPPITLHTMAGTTDGTCERDYVHVSDIADAVAAALAIPGRHALNIGRGRSYSSRQIIELCEEITGCEIAHAAGAERRGDVPRTRAAVGLAVNTIGWLPRRGILDTLESAWEWHRLHPSGYATQPQQPTNKGAQP